MQQQKHYIKLKHNMV